MLNKNDIRKANARCVDWDALRYKAAVSAMQGLLSNASLVDPAWDFRVNVEKTAVAVADALIAELKKEPKEELSQPVTKSGDKDDFIPVGETFEFEGERFKCAEMYNGCIGCAFEGKDCGDTPPCGYLGRQDGKDVIFKKVEGFTD